MNTKSRLTRVCLSIAALFATAFAATTLRAQEVVKANNTDALNLGSSWVGGTVPTSSNVAAWDSTVTAANTTTSLGDNLALAGIKITNPGGAIGITSGTVNSGAVTANSTADTFTYTGTDVVNGNIVSFGGTTMPVGITNGRLYFIVNVDTTAKTYQVSDTSAGSAINFTSNGASVTNTAVSALTIGSSGIDLGSATRSLATLSAPVSLSAPQTWTTGSNRVIDINNNTNNSGVAVLNNGNALTIDTVGNSTIDLGNISGGGGITKNGAGTLNLYGGASNYTGDVVINAGTVNAGSDAGSLGAGSLTMNGGTLTAKANGARSFGRNTTIGGNASFYNNNSSNNGSVAYTFGTLSIGSHTFTVTANGSGTGTLTFGATTLAGSPTFDVGSRDINFLVLGAVGESGGSRGFTKSGVGTLRLTGASTYTGTTTISGGLLELTGAGSLPAAGAVVNDATLNVSAITASGLTIGSLAGSGTFAIGGNALTLGDSTSTTFSGEITGSGGAVVKQGAGRLTLSGSSSYDGTTALQSGTLRAANAAAFGSGSLTLAGGRLELAADVSGTFGPGGGYAASVTGDATIASDRVTSGTGVALALGSLSIGAHTLTVAAGDAVTSGVAGLSVGGSTTLTGNATVSPAAGAELRLGAISGGFTLAKTGSGALTLTGGGHAGSFDIQAGRLNLDSGNALGDSSGSLTLAVGVTLDNTSGNTVTISSGKPVSLGSSLSFLGSSDLSLGAGTVSLSGSTAIDVAAGRLTFAGDVTGAGAGIVKTGTGVLELSGLSGTNSFSGNSFIDEGELFISAGSILGGGTSTTITVGENGLLRIGSSASQGQVTIASRAGGVITGTTINANFTFDTTSALIADNANFNGVQTILSGVVLSSTSSSDWLGSLPPSPTAGRIVLQDDATLRATIGVTIDQNKGILLESGTARFESTTSGQALVLASTISGSGALLKTGSGGFRVTGTSNTYTGGTIVRQGTFGIHADGSLGDVAGRLLLDGGTVNSAQDTSFVEIASGREVVVANGKTGGMDATPGGLLRYAGGITEEDPLGIAAGMRFGSGSRTGTVLLDGTSTYRGTTLVQAGTLALGENASIATSPLVTVAAGATFDVSARSGGFALTSGQTIGGLGTVVGGVTVGSGAFVSPGGSTGTLTGGTYAFAGAGTYVFEVNDASGTAGSTSLGWDLLAVDALSITATTENPFTIAIVSLNASQQPGLASFNPSLGYSWKFLTSGEEIGGFDASLFTLDLSGFQNSYDGMFSLARGDAVGGTANELYVVYAAVPEPATIALAGIGLLGVVWMSRRHRHGVRSPA